MGGVEKARRFGRFWTRVTAAPSLDLLKVQHFKVGFKMLYMNKFEKFVIAITLILGFAAILYILVEILKGEL
jgi:hypothetical protein